MKKILILLLLLISIPLVKAEETEDLAPNAKSAIMIEASTGEILFQKNKDEKLAPASMTKMMSMLLIMEEIENGNLKWNEMITTSEKASSMGGSQIFLKVGEKMTVEDLLKGVAIASGNDAVVALAERVSGSEEQFVKRMNIRAKDLGLKNTNFINATGLTGDNHYSSAYDMSLIAKELVKHEKILEFTSTYEDYLRKDTKSPFWLVNTNRLVRFKEGVDGLKTGFTDEAGYCLTATMKKDNMRLITVVMKEENTSKRSADTTKMLDYGFNIYMVQTILDEKTTIEPVKHAEENIPQPKAEMPKITPVQQRVDFTQYEIIGQLFSCYWIVQHDDEVIFIDQHAMHERRLYERIIERDIPADSQQLLTPEIIKLTPVEFALLMDNIDRFSEIGFDIEEFGAMSVSVRAVPVVMGKTDIKRFLTDAIALFDAKNKLTTIDMKRGALITRACKSAIKAGERISETEIRALLDQYDKEGVPLTCPHGRPVMARMTKTEFEKLFKRIV